MSNELHFLKMSIYIFLNLGNYFSSPFIKKNAPSKKCEVLYRCFPDYFLDIGGMLVHSVLKSNQIAQHVVADVGKSKQNGTAGRI